MDATQDASPSKLENPLTVRALHSFAQAEPLRSAWNNLVANSGADIYQTFEWCSIWWKYYGKNRALHLLLCFSSEALVGVIPAFVETLWFGPVRIRAAKIVGADFSLTLCNLPVISSSLTLVTTHAIEYFLKQQRCDLFSLGSLAGPHAGIKEIFAAGHNLPNLVVRTKTFTRSCNTYFSLPASFEDYLKSLDKKQRSNFKRMMEQSSKAYRVTFDTLSAAEQMTPEFELFCQQHEVQWRADGKLGHFGDWPHAREFNRDLIRAFATQGNVRFYRILANNQVISSQYCYVFGQTVYWRLPARIRNSEWDRFSLGTMGLIRMIESLITEGVNTIEAGRGHYGYKIQHGAREWPMYTIHFMRRGFGVSLRVLLFKRFAALLNLVYYKVLFIRLAHRIPLMQRPLWKFWVRHTL